MAAQADSRDAWPKSPRPRLLPRRPMPPLPTPSAAKQAAEAELPSAAGAPRSMLPSPKSKAAPQAKAAKSRPSARPKPAAAQEGCACQEAAASRAKKAASRQDRPPPSAARPAAKRAGRASAAKSVGRQAASTTVIQAEGHRSWPLPRRPPPPTTPPRSRTLAADVQARAKAAYDKSQAYAASDRVHQGQRRSHRRSGKILAAGVQDMGKTYVAEAKSAYETVTADVKEMAAVKSPTELFQLQGEIARRNFDTWSPTPRRTPKPR